MKEIAVVTATRAEYGLLKPVILALQASPHFAVSVLVTGTHLSKAFGYTVQEIKKDNIHITAEIPILSDSDSPRGVSQTMSNALLGFSAYFEAHRPDAVMVLGDRYEILAVCCAAMNERIPILHLHVIAHFIRLHLHVIPPVIRPHPPVRPSARALRTLPGTP